MPPRQEYTWESEGFVNTCPEQMANSGDVVPLEGNLIELLSPP